MSNKRSELRMEFAGRSPSFTRSKRMRNERSELQMQFVGRSPCFTNWQSLIQSGNSDDKNLATFLS